MQSADPLIQDYLAAIRVLDAEAHTLPRPWTPTNYRLHLLRRMNQLALAATPTKPPGQDTPKQP